jgi:curved DNA-binding protein CbpA
LKQRKRLNNAASRRIDKFRSDRSKKMNSDTMNMMLDSQQNSVRDQSWSVQIEHFQLNVASRTLRAAFNQRSSRVFWFKKKIIWSINNKNKLLRKQYAETHKMHTVVDFWQYVHFTNEAHFDSNQMLQKQTLREEDIRYEKKNMQTMSNMKRIKLHVVVFISWHHKEVLQFYNDEHDMSDIQIKKSRKSRKRKHETKNEYRQRVIEWETFCLMM